MPGFSGEFQQFPFGEMAVPDDAMRPFVVSFIACTSSDKFSVKAGESESEIVRVEKGEGPGVGGPEHKSAARPKDATELNQGRRSVFFRNVFEDLDTAQTIEM